MSIIETIRAEIERRMVELSKDKYIDLHDTLCRTKELNRLLSFLSSLESQKPMVQEGFSKEFDEYFVPKNSEQKGRWGFADIFSLARHFFDLGCRRTAEKYDEIEYNRQRAEEHLATSGKTISVKPGDEVAINGHKIVYYKDKGYVTIVKSEESVPNDLEEMADNYEQEFFTDATLGEAFIAGAEWDREQMMKEAVDTVVSLDAGGFPFVEFGVGKFGLKVGNKVRVIVLPKEVRNEQI